MRRDFLTPAGAAVTFSRIAVGQQSAKVPRSRGSHCPGATYCGRLSNTDRQLLETALTQRCDLEKPDIHPLAVAQAWLNENHRVATATVVETWGSAPRPAGSVLVIDGGGNFQGSVSGGCVEGEVIAAAADAMATGRHRLLEFGIADETAWRAGLSCGGRIKVLVQPVAGGGALNAQAIADLNAARRARAPLILVTDLATGKTRLASDAPVSADPIARALRGRFASGASGVEPGPSGETLFFAVNLPQPRLIAIGAVHIAQALAPIAAAAGFDMTVIDPRTAFAAPERFPGVCLLSEWPDVALPKAGLDGYTALACLTHDPKIDDAALITVLSSPCFYVGALGSRATHAKRLDRLRAAGVSDEELRRIRAPIGLAIGAGSAGEIGVAIVAEIIATLRQARNSRFLTP